MPGPLVPTTENYHPPVAIIVLNWFKLSLGDLLLGQKSFTVRMHSKYVPSGCVPRRVYKWT